MRIAILADPIDNQNAGIHVFTREMVNALVESNPGHEIILIREKFDPDLKGVKQITLWNTRLPIGYASLRLFIMIPAVLHYLGVDVVVEPAHFGPFNLVKRIKRVTIIHDLTPILFPDLHRWHSQFLQNVFLKRILKHTDLIIANSENTKNDICITYPSNCNKVKRIYPGKGEIYKPTIDQSIFEKYGISKPYFLFVGTIEPRKNLKTLLKAFDIFKDNDAQGFELIIAGGKGWKTESFDSDMSNTKYKSNVKCIGFVDTADLPALYSQCVALIYPSQYEGFGLPVIEAMSCGVPVITAYNSSLIEAGAKGALFFDTYNSEMLATKMQELISNETNYQKLKQDALIHASEFSWEKFATNFWSEISK